MRRIACLLCALALPMAAHAEQWVWMYPDKSVKAAEDKCKLLPPDLAPAEFLDSTLGAGDDTPTVDMKTPDGARMVVFSRDGAAYAFFTTAASCLRERPVMLSNPEGATAPPAKQPSSAQSIPDENIAHIEFLKSKYRSRLHFGSAEAERIVSTFDIDCNMPDGRILPFINVLYEKLSLSDSEQGWLEIFADERGGEVRVTEGVASKASTSIKVFDAFLIDKWGRVQALGGIKVAAVMEACYGSYGPIWIK